MLVAAIQTIVCVRAILEQISALIKKNRWIKNAICMEAIIVDRKLEYDDYAEFREDQYHCELILAIPPLQSETDTNARNVKAFVSKKVYDWYVRRKVARVFFYTTDPLVIHVDDE